MNRSLFLISLLLIQKGYAQGINTTSDNSINSSQQEKLNPTVNNLESSLKKEDKIVDKEDIQKMPKNSVFINNTEIYEVTINENWAFSGLTKIENNKLFIPLKFLPSDLLGNLIITEKNTQIIKNEKNLVVSYDFVKARDDEKLSLSINLTEDFFKSQRLVVDKNKKLDSHPINAFYTNYSLNMDDSGVSSMRGTFNTVWASKDNWLFKNGMFWNGDKLVRLNSTWQKTYSDYSGLSVGDINDTSLSGFGSVSSLGVKYSTPYFNSTTSLSQLLPSIPISGFAVTPSKMDLFLNSQLIQKKEISSGRYSIDVPYQTQGYGVFQAYVYDLNGKPNIVSVPFYSNNEIIKKGSNEYSVTAGFIRKDNSSSSGNYDKPYFSGIYKGGITDNWTQDLYFQYSSYYSVVSGLGHVVPYAPLGMFNLGLSRNSLSQSLYKLGWERTGIDFSVGGDFQKSPNSNTGFCLGYNQSCIKTQKSFFVGTSLPYGLGGLNMSYIDRVSSNGQSKIASLQWNKQINKYVNAFSSFSSSKSLSLGQGATNNKIFYFGLSINFGNNLYSNTAYTKDRNGGPSYQQSAYKAEDPLHPEYGYGSVTLNKTNQSSTQNLYYGARLSNFSYQVNSYKDEKGINTNLSADGAFSYIPEENYFKFSKTMNGGLVFVNIDNLTIPAAISHENRYAGMSDKNGHFLVSDAVALNNENISIDINKLPKSITLEENKKQFFIPFSGAVRVDFKSKPLPYVVKIKGVPTGAIFEMKKEFYVVGDKGNVSVEGEGETQIPMEGGEVCTLNITKKQKEYVCVANNNDVKNTPIMKKENDTTDSSITNDSSKGK